MSDYRRVLERGGRQFEPPDDALERMFRRRDRRVRNQRIAAGVVALALFAGTAFGLASTITGERTVEPLAPITDPAVLERALIGPEEAPEGTEFVARLERRERRDRLVRFLLVGSDAQVAIRELGIVHDVGHEFRAPRGSFQRFVSAVLAFGDEEAAERGLGLIADDMRLAVPTRPEEEIAAPGLGEAAIGLAGPFDPRRPDTPGVAYLWRTRNVVLVGFSVGEELSTMDVLGLAREMDRRLPGRE